MANEKRLIDANLLEVVFGNAKKSCRTDLMRSIYSVVLKAVNEAPTVDAVEVVHAHWIGSRFNPMTDEYEEYCSHCCAWSSEYGKPFCPNCGAKMDGDGNA